MNDHPFDDVTYPELVFAYRRTDAIADGVLVDATEAARQMGFRHPVAITRGAWDRSVAMTSAAERAGHTENGRLRDLLWMLLCALRWSEGAAELAFDLLCVTTRPDPIRVPLRAVVGPSDQGEAVITVMMAGES